MSAEKQTDFLIIGAGCVGLALARELAERTGAEVTIVEREPRLGRFASGHNSGVLHSGLFYRPDSLKAKWAIEGRSYMLEFLERYFAVWNEVFFYPMYGCWIRIFS